MEHTPREEDLPVDGLEPDAAILEAVEEVDAESTAEVMSLLHEGVPLTLLADLVKPEGPESPSILADEGLPDDAWWGPAPEADLEDEEPQGMDEQD